MPKDTHTCFACGERGHKAVNCAETNMIIRYFSRLHRRRGPVQGRNNATLAALAPTAPLMLLPILLLPPTLGP
ncbi:hypothetical protein MW887_002744 [Aspergillus wentii]|nr:hypothetical protein MW887_002744 [Aspergillus wentii]